MMGSDDADTKSKLLSELMSYLQGSDAKDLGSKFGPPSPAADAAGMAEGSPAEESAESPDEAKAEGDDASDPMAMLSKLDPEQLKALLAQIGGGSMGAPQAK